MKKSIILKNLLSDDESVSVKLEMSSYYKEFINAIPDKSKDREERFKHGVACIIWGAFYLEAVINDTSMKILEDGTQGIIENADILWPFVEKARTEEKLEFIIKTFKSDYAMRNRFHEQVKSLFKLRNKLAHFKEKPNEVRLRKITAKANVSEKEKIYSRIDAAKQVTPSIVDAVLSVSVQDRRKEILKIGKWIEQAIFEYYKTRKQ